MPSPLENIERGVILRPPLTNKEGARDPVVYVQVGRQFGVENNPRYMATRVPRIIVDPHTGLKKTIEILITWCNIFASDFITAMGAPLPHWITPDNKPATPNTSQARELNVNALVGWMETYGRFAGGWRAVSSKAAQDRANLGFPTIAMWRAPPQEHGHIAVVIPGTHGPGGCCIAQAGAKNFWGRTTNQGFGAREPSYWTHD